MVTLPLLKLIKSLVTLNKFIQEEWLQVPYKMDLKVTTDHLLGIKSLLRILGLIIILTIKN